MKKGEIYEGIIEKVEYPNRGFVYIDGEKVLVKNGIPGQKVRLMIQKKRSGRVQGRILEVLEKSPLEQRAPVCGIFPECGGCMYQTMLYEQQLSMKERQIRELLDRAMDAGVAGGLNEVMDGRVARRSGEELDAGAAGRSGEAMDAGAAGRMDEAMDVGAAGRSGEMIAVGGNGVPAGTENGESRGESYQWDGIYGSPSEFAYRNKMEFSFGDAYKDGPLCLGLHKKGSTYDVLTAADCKIVHPDMARILSCVLEYFGNRGVSYYKKMQHTGYLRHLLLRRSAATGELLIHIVTTTQEEHDLTALAKELLELPLEGKIAGILHLLNDSLSDVVQSDETRILYGQNYFYERLLGLTFKVSTFSFFQPNSGAAEVLYRIVREYIGDTREKVVFDLYSGTGTIAQLAAAVAKEVVGVEIVEEAVQAARENATRNGLQNCRFIAGDVLQVLDELTEKPDLIILDPPRDGIHPKALPKILRYNVEHIVYISCKATSLVRDLESFRAAGYYLERACCVDQFCQTVHVETVVMLSHKKPDSIINVKVEFGEGEGKVPLDNIAKRAAAYKPKERVTYKMIKEYIEAKYGFKVHTAYVAEVKRDLGLPMYDAPNAVEELKQPRKHPTPEKVEAIKDALKHFEVI